MSFFWGQEHLSAVQWIARAFVGYIFLLIASKCMGNRAISQSRFLDFVVALLLGNILAHPLSDEGLGLLGPMITTFVIALLYIGNIYATLKWKWARRLFEPEPITIIKRGMVQHDNLNKVRISENYLLAELRLQQVDDIQKVRLALWEPSGRISIFLEKKSTPVTLEDIGKY